MTLSLYDPSAQGLREVPSDQTPVLVCGPTLGAPEGVAALRPRVLHDVLSRALLFQKYEPDTELHSSLSTVVQGELGDACEAETLRYWSLTTHYRAPVSWVARSSEPHADASGAAESGPPSLDESERRLSYLYAAKKRLLELPEARIINVQTAPAAALATLPDGLTQALERDLDTPLALAELQEFALAVNALCDHALRKKGRVNLSAVQSAQAGFATVEGLLGVGGDAPAAFLSRVRDRRARRKNIDPDAVNRTVTERASARAQQDFATADRLQAELLSLGVTLLDGPDGSTWTLT